MRITFLHGWLRGNLGDLCISDAVVRAVRSRFPFAHIRFYTETCASWEIPESFRTLVDECVSYDYHTLPEQAVNDADVVIQAPGGGLQDPDDPRGACMVRDARYCKERGIPYILAGQSFHSSFDLSAFRGCFILAREPDSHELLEREGIGSVLTADPAFLMDCSGCSGARSGTAVFLRRWHTKHRTCMGNILTLDSRTFPFTPPLTLATSDPFRDDKILLPLQEAWNVPYERCLDFPHLLRTIVTAGAIISDRYHPVIFASLLGTPFTFVTREGSLRDQGLLRHLSERSHDELRRLAEDGLRALCDVIADSPVRR